MNTMRLLGMKFPFSIFLRKCKSYVVVVATVTMIFIYVEVRNKDRIFYSKCVEANDKLVGDSNIF